MKYDEARHLRQATMIQMIQVDRKIESLQSYKVQLKTFLDHMDKIINYDENG